MLLIIHWLFNTYHHTNPLRYRKPKIVFKCISIIYSIQLLYVCATVGLNKSRSSFSSLCSIGWSLWRGCVRRSLQRPYTASVLYYVLCIVLVLTIRLAERCLQNTNRNGCENASRQFISVAQLILSRDPHYQSCNSLFSHHLVV